MRVFRLNFCKSAFTRSVEGRILGIVEPNKMIKLLAYRGGEGGNAQFFGSSPEREEGLVKVMLSGSTTIVEELFCGFP